ncbi:MAG: xanthine dehydrogenase family protein subunit M [Gammaproteobacteria bacterium]|jgi:xanthine dehydrogenase YagS FAD-binding subunit|nr:xanthine dehydrogenase family protein subunit M [Gammaproteobacteria bacterium]MBT3859775.1 xanthine dehydrogenase family protein subunit M [Gammaproteobacteria bacterium]MBT3988830.1 xanthine dehydrogenase family protein subunit M [Gammaproteobacteria bacterium]MBT4582235.1 xanthine dehydrogenase family protein subunit M [Gammaproteobacteria bacterium]MBT4660259.1 xanthine dehydrogenase family protein subunit M [Gammaproteobacteria bacterium]
MPSHDVMPNMELYQPVQVEDALAIADRLAERAWLVGGGQDTYGWLKDRAKSVDAMIDLSAIESLRGIRETSDGIEIGALTTLTEVTESEVIQQQYSLLSMAASRVASPQIRNIGTLGGNASQDVRCWYYRRGLDCYRAGGNLCYADTPQGMNREHSLFETSRCVAASPSDTAPALVALDATMVIQSSSGVRTVAAEDYFVGPANDIENTTVLRPGDILTAVRIPNTWANASFYFEKVADRNVWDFALVNIAAAFKLSGDTIQESRIVAGSVQATPRRVSNVENAIRGQSRSAATADSVASMATDGARALAHNGFKIPLMENLVKRAIIG